MTCTVPLADSIQPSLNTSSIQNRRSGLFIPCEPIRGTMGARERFDRSCRAVSNRRTYAGIHYNSTTEVGAGMGQRIGDAFRAASAVPAVSVSARLHSSLSSARFGATARSPTSSLGCSHRIQICLRSTPYRIANRRLCPHDQRQDGVLFLHLCVGQDSEQGCQ